MGRVPPTKQADGTLAFGPHDTERLHLTEANMRFLATENDDPSFNWRTLRFPGDLPRLAAMTEILSPSDPDLRPYKNRGGKIILYHGWADPAISAYGTLDYYEKVAKAVGGQARSRRVLADCTSCPGCITAEAALDQTRSTCCPSSRHGSSAVLRRRSVIATHSTDGKVDRTRPLCPHPQVARYTGRGSIDDAANFRCEAATR